MRPGQHRETARILLHENHERLFLLLTHHDPEVQLPPRWLTPGGGIDDGETTLEAAVRELREETGIEVEPDLLGEPVFESRGRWDWGDGVHHHTYVDYFYQLDITSLDDPDQPGEKLSSASFKLNNKLWTIDEHRDVLEHRWWTLHEVEATNETIGPPELAIWLRSWIRASKP